MAKEIEYKFIVTDVDAVAEMTPPTRYEIIKQGYFVGGGEGTTIRVRISTLSDGSKESFITVKSPADGMTRYEWEYPIPNEDAEEMMELCANCLIEKTRYFFDFKGHVVELDIFEGRHQGLMIAEIEVADENEVVEFPTWFDRDVTRDHRFTNAYLSLP